MRLFIAVDVNDALRDELRRVRAEIESSFVGTPHPRVTWVDPSRAHVTLRFIGEVDADPCARVCAVLAPPLAHAPFEVAWQGVGAFPSAKSPRSIWMNAAEGVDGLRALAELVATRIDRIVGAGDGRPFRAHLTLGRVREQRSRAGWGSILRSVRAEPVAATVDHVTLYESRLSPRGPTYTALARTELVKRSALDIPASP